MSRLLIVVALFFLSVQTINCDENRVHLEVDYDIKHKTDGKYFVANPLLFTCQRGLKFIIRPVDQILEIEVLEEVENTLKPFCSFANPFNPAACVLYDEEKQPCTLYVDSRTTVTVPLGDGSVKVKKRTTHPSTREIYFVLHLNKVRVTKTFEVKYKVGTYPDEMGCFGKLGRFIQNSKWHFEYESTSQFQFTCGPTSPVEIDCSKMECTGLDVPYSHIHYSPTKSSKIFGYVVKNKSKYDLKPAQLAGALPSKVFCTIYLNDQFEVGLPRMALKRKRHINILHNGSEEKRGFRVFRRLNER